jgi:hypothetical protein
MLRTTPETTQAVRVLTAELTADLGGGRLTHDRVIAAAVQVAQNHRDEMLALLR